MVFITLVLAELVNAFNCRSDYLSAFQGGALSRTASSSSPSVLSLAMMVAVIEWEPLARLFHTTPLRWQDWLLATVLSLLILPVVEAAKWWLRRGMGKGKRGKGSKRGMGTGVPPVPHRLDTVPPKSRGDRWVALFRTGQIHG